MAVVNALDFGPGGGLRFARSTPRSMGGDATGAARYPNPFFDIAQTYLPSSFKTLLRWCRYYFLTNPIINAAVYKMAEYPVTDLVFDTDNELLRDQWESLFHRTLNYRKFEIEIGLDYGAYGNSMISIHFPFNKWLVCKACGSQVRVEKQAYVFREFRFTGSCQRCHHHGPFDVRDVYVRSVKGIRLIRWNPEDISIEHNDATGESRYYYVIPPALSNDIRMGKRLVIERIPQLFIDALRMNRALLFGPRNLFHLKRPVIAQKDKGWGMPMILPVLKDAFALQILRKAQEAIALEHVVPMRMLFPQSATQSSDVYSSTNLVAWRNKVEQEILRWRLDCVTPETLVETRSGLLRADEVVEGDEVKNHTGTYSKVVKLWRRPLREGELAYRLKVRGLSAVRSVFSEGHPLWAAKKFNNGNGHKLGTPSMIRVKDLRAGDYVGYPISRSVEPRATIDLADYVDRAATARWVYTDYLETATPEAFEYLEAGGTVGSRQALLEERGWSVNQFKVAQIALREGRTLCRLPRCIPFDEELAWVVGLYLAEGNSAPKQVAFALHKNEYKFVVRLQQFFSERFDALSFITKRSEHGIQLFFSSVIAAQFFGNLCPGDSRTKQVPAVYKTADDRIVAQLLHGMFDGDGCRHEDGYSNKLSYASASRQMAEDYRQLCVSLGVPVSITFTAPHEYNILGKTGVSAGVYRVYAHGPAKARFLSLIEGKPSEKLESVHAGVYRDGFFWHRISEVAEVEASEVIGIQTDSSEVHVTLDDKEVHGTFCTWGMGGGNSNYVPILPLPMGQQTLGGDGKALLLTQEYRVWLEQIVAGLGVPQELLYGGLCCDSNELAVTDRGLVPLGQLAPEVVGRTRDAPFEVANHEGVRRAVLAHNVGLKHSWRLRTKRGFSLRAAGTHPVLTLRPDLNLEFRPLQELEPGDYVVRKQGSDLWARTPCELPVYRQTAQKTSARRKDLQLPCKMTADLARLLGYLVSEGCIDEERVRFANTEQEVVDDFVRCFEAVFGFRPGGYYRDKGGGKPAWFVEIWSRDLSSFLRQLGFWGKSHEKQIPWAVLQSTKEHVAEFVRAFFEGDGTVSIKPNNQGGTARAFSISEQLIRQLQIVLQNAGIDSSIYGPSKNSPCFKLDIRGNLAKFRAFAGFISQRKRAALDALIACRGPGHTPVVPYARERINELKRRHLLSAWTRRKFKLQVDPAQVFSFQEAAALFDRTDVGFLYEAVEAGQLAAEREGRRWAVSGAALISYCAEHGLHERSDRQWPRFYKPANIESLRGADLSLIAEHDPELMKRLTRLMEGDLRFDRVVDVESEDSLIPMADLTVEGVHAYIAGGIVCHNSFSGSNVSLRILENHFLDQRAERLSLVRNFIMPAVAAFMGWEPVDAHYKRFKMADDLQRSAFFLQLNQAGKLSDRSLLEDTDWDAQVEAERIAAEQQSSTTNQRRQALAQASIQGEAQLTMQKYQLRAQKAAQEQLGAPMDPAMMGEQAMAAQQMSGQPGMISPQAMGAMGAGQQELATQMGQTPPPDPTLSQPPMADAQGALPAEAQSPLSAEQQPAIGLQEVAERLARELDQRPQDEQASALMQLRQQNPQLAAYVVSLLEVRRGAHRSSSGMARPKERAPRRGPEATTV